MRRPRSNCVQISPPASSQHRQIRRVQTQRLSQDEEKEIAQIRLPRAVQATYMLPLKREPTHNIPSCNLQLRSYSVRNLEVFADFAMRAAYFLDLPAAGPVPLPKITERWTVPRANFIFKKSQENFERITLRRLIQIKDGHPDTVSLWLAFLRKFQYYGVGMKANVFEHSGLDVPQNLDEEAKRLEEKLGQPNADTSNTLSPEMHTELYKAQWGAFGPMSANQEVPRANERIARVRVKSKEEQRSAKS